MALPLPTNHERWGEMLKACALASLLPSSLIEFVDFDKIGYGTLS